MGASGICGGRAAAAAPCGEGVDWARTWAAEISWVLGVGSCIRIGYLSIRLYRL
ncbi:MAG: hypothetical protein ACLUA4_03245 [Bifidobacterium sp.]